MSEGLPDIIIDKSKAHGLIPEQCQHTNLAFIEQDVGNKKFNLNEFAKHVISLESKPKRQRKAPLRPKKRLTSSEKRNLQLFSVEKIPKNYNSYLPLHNLWCEYMRTIFTTQTLSFDTEQINGILAKADYHGSIFTVMKSKCPTYVGTVGIMIKESKNTVSLITKENRLKVIPKQHCVFTFELDQYLFTVYGNHFRIRASERAARKIKSKATLDL